MVKRILLMVIVLIMLLSVSINAYAQEGDMPDEYEELVDGLPNDIQKLLPDGLFSNDSEEVLGAIKEMSTWKFLLNTVFDFLGLNLKNIVKVIATVCSILVVSSIIKATKNTIKNEATFMVLELISSAVLVIALIELTRAPLERTMIMLDNMKVFVNTLSPLICSMYAMGGNVTSALINNYGLIVFLSIFENVCVLALEMILGICVSLTLASAFLANGNLISLSSSIKKGFSFFVGLAMLIFTTVLSTQNILAAKADNLSTKTVKMLAGQMIPLVGSTIGESLKTAGASIEYLRSNVGIALLIMLLLLVLPTLMSILLFRIGLIFSNTMAELLDCRREGSVLAELSSIYGYAVAILSICSISLLFLITVFAKSVSPLT